MANQHNGSSGSYFAGASSNDYYNQHPQQYSPPIAVSQHSPYSEGPTPAESDRGLLGAIGGGVAGGYAGKQTCHGFLGTVGGAIVGSLTEDWVKKKANSRPCSPQPPPAQVCPPPPPQQQHCPPPAHQYPYGVPVAAATHTTVNVDSYAAAGAWQASPPPSYGHPQPQYHGQGYGHQQPVKPCGHSGHCMCKVTGSFWKS